MPEVAMDIDESSNSSVQIIEEKNVVSTSVGWRLKLLKFHKNHRPAYYGTMRKTSNHISPRNPFKKDMVTKLVITILHKKVNTGCTCIQCCTYCFSLTINTLIYYLWKIFSIIWFHTKHWLIGALTFNFFFVICEFHCNYIVQQLIEQWTDNGITIFACASQFSVVFCNIWSNHLVLLLTVISVAFLFHYHFELTEMLLAVHVQTPDTSYFPMIYYCFASLTSTISVNPFCSSGLAWLRGG